MMEKNINVDRDNQSYFFPSLSGGTTSVILLLFATKWDVDKTYLNLHQHTDTTYNSFEEYKSSTQLDTNKLKEESVINIEKEFKCTNNLH